MSRRIFKNRETVSTHSFQFESSQSRLDFQDGQGGGVTSLDAEAELDAFEAAERYAASHHKQPEVDVEAIIERAQEEAVEIVKAARRDAAQIEREAYQKGLEEGRKTGEIMAEQTIQSQMRAYRDGLAALNDSRDLMINQLQLDLLELILHTAEKVVSAELETHPKAVLGMVRDAIQTLKQRREMTVYLNSDDHQFMTQISEAEMKKWMGSLVRAEIDPNLSRGSFRIETPSGELDGSIETKLQQLQEQLRRSLEDHD